MPLILETGTSDLLLIERKWVKGYKLSGNVLNGSGYLLGKGDGNSTQIVRENRSFPE